MARYYPSSGTSEISPNCGGQVREAKPVQQVIEELVLRPYRMVLTTYKGKCAKCETVHSTHPF